MHPSLSNLISCSCITVYTIIGIYFEEKKLVKDFGESYIQYRDETPMLIPKFIYNNKYQLNMKNETSQNDDLIKELISFLTKGNAHVTFNDAVKNIPFEDLGKSLAICLIASGK